MDTMEKVEALRKKANISYEEAKNVLEQANGDLLDAMVILERQSKINKPETEIVIREETDENTVETTSEAAKNESSKQTKEPKEAPADSIGKKVKTIVEKVMQVTGQANTARPHQKPFPLLSYS